MPFTLAHPAAVVPLARRWPHVFVPSALVVGSIVPDVEYFVRGELRSVWSHTLAGLVAFCLPVGLLLLWLYHRVQKPALLNLLPAPLQHRLAPWSGPCVCWPAPRLVCLSLSVLVGAATHLAWDSLTHPNGLFAPWAPGLDAPLVTLAGIPISGFRLLQDGSTALGLLLLLSCVYRALVATPPTQRASRVARSRRERVLRALAIALIGLLLAWAISFHLNKALSPDPLRRLVQQLALSGIPGLYLSVTLYGLWTLRRHRHHGEGRARGFRRS